jgi:hypothetical protein
MAGRCVRSTRRRNWHQECLHSSQYSHCPQGFRGSRPGCCMPQLLHRIESVPEYIFVTRSSEFAGIYILNVDLTYRDTHTEEAHN